MLKKEVTFKDFVRFFPRIKPPITLTEESQREFSKRNRPFSLEVIRAFLDKENVNSEFTEYIPCLQLPKLNNKYLLIYWKAEVLNYEYIFCSYNKSGKLIDKKRIGGIVSDGKKIIHSVATINENLIIHIFTGEKNNTITTKSEEHKSMSFEILKTGELQVILP